METPASAQTLAPAPNKKLFYGAIAFVAVIIIFILITVLTSTTSKKQPVQNQPQNTVSSDQKDQNVTYPSQSPNAVGQSGNVYKNSLFSINYPDGWKTQEVKLASGGIEVKIVPVAKDSLEPNIFVIADSISAKPSIRQKEGTYTNLGFVSSTTLLDTISADKLTGTLPPLNKLGTASATAKVLQMTHIFTDRGNYSYLIAYSYFGRGSNSQYETLFTKMISSFKFAQ